MLSFNKILSTITAISISGAFMFALPAAASTAAYSPEAEMGVRIAAESAAGGIVTEGNLGSGIAKGSAEEGWTAVEAIGEGTDGRAQNRYDMGTASMEVGYGQSKRFALIEKYSVDNLAQAESLEFAYTGAANSQQHIAIWLYDGEMPMGCSVNTTGAENTNEIIQTLARSYGIYSGNSTAEDATVAGADALSPLAKSDSAPAENAVSTITVDGAALEMLKAAAVYDENGKGTFVITVNGASLTSNTTAKIYMNGSEEVSPEYYPQLTVSYGSEEVSDAPEGAVVMKDAVSNSDAVKAFDIDSETHITAVTTNSNNSVWYIGDYDPSDITAFTAKAIMCPGYTDDEITTTPELNVAYMDIADGDVVDADYITLNDKTIRGANRKLCSYAGYTVTESDVSEYGKFSEVIIENTSDVSGLKHLFVYGTASKARIYIDYITMSGARLADYPEGAKGVYNQGLVTNYDGGFKKMFISDDEYRNITDFKNRNDYIWYLGTYNLSALDSIDISAVMTAVAGEDGNLYYPSVKLAYMPIGETAVNAEYLEENSKTIRSAANMLCEWIGSEDAPAVKSITKADLKEISETRIELFVYGTTQVKYTVGEESLNAQPSLGLDYVKVTSVEPSAFVVTASDDMQLRLSNSNDYRTTSCMEFKVTDDARYAFTGAMKFAIADISDYVNSGYRIKSAVLRTTTMKRSNSSELKAVPFTTDFSESYAKNDVLGDELKSTIDYVTENYKSYTIGAVSCAASGKKLNEYAETEDADPDLSRWYNTVDITDYLAGAAKGGANELPILIYTASETDKTGNQLCTKDIANDGAWEAIRAFYTINGSPVTAADFAPTLFVEFESGAETAEPFTVLTSRVYRNRVDIRGGYDYLGWKCSKDITYNGKDVPAGESIYSLASALEQNPDTSETDYELVTFYVRGTDFAFANGGVNARTNPYVEADGTVQRPQVTEFINEIKLSDDLIETAEKVYTAVYTADGTLKSVNMNDPAAQIAIEIDENGCGITVAPNEIIKVFVWGESQTAVYTMN